MNNNYTIHKYYITSSWKYLKKSTDVVYDENGNNPLTQVTDYFYDHRNLLANRIETKNSKGEIIKKEYKYPYDFAVSGNVYGNMVAKNMIEIPVETKTYHNAQLQITERTNFSDAWYADKHIIAVNNIDIQRSGFSNESRFAITKYDTYGKPVSFSKDKDITESYVWNDFSQPVARVVNAV